MRHGMREKYIDLMEKALSAYTDEHIKRYLREVKENGLTEHGFPRLTANIGILIAHGRRVDLLPLFTEMMDVCCSMFLRPRVKAANEFSVREIVFCIAELEKAGAADSDRILCWKEQISRIVPEECYDVIVGSESDRITNWAVFGALSEYARLYFGLGENIDFIERQLSCQLQWIDENGMYRDNKSHECYQPIMYDLVPRGLFSLLLKLGYRGRYYEKIDDCLQKAGLLTLKMQSPNGEMPFGGRSNQFVHTEPWLAAVFEYEAVRYEREGNTELARALRSAAARALAVTEEWLSKDPILHIKNRFPTETKYGCEGYAYFDKYMITAASNLYAAYLLSDSTVKAEAFPDHEPTAFVTSHYFHKVFLKSGGYMAEIDTNADPKYDASGLGRVHREGAPSAICMSVPCPSRPSYKVDVEKPAALSVCAGVYTNGEWSFATDPSVKYEVKSALCDSESARASVLCRFPDGACVNTEYTVSEKGVTLALCGSGRIACLLPAFSFDGEKRTEITVGENELTVSYNGYVCRYTVSGSIVDRNVTAANRNGHYRTFAAEAEDTLCVKIEIVKE